MKLKTLLKDTPVWLYIFILAIICGATVFQTMVLLPEFTRDMPNSMIALANSQIKPSNFLGFADFWNWRNTVTYYSFNYKLENTTQKVVAAFIWICYRSFCLYFHVFYSAFTNYGTVW